MKAKIRNRYARVASEGQSTLCLYPAHHDDAVLGAVTVDLGYKGGESVVCMWGSIATVAIPLV